MDDLFKEGVQQTNFYMGGVKMRHSYIRQYLLVTLIAALMVFSPGVLLAQNDPGSASSGETLAAPTGGLGITTMYAVVDAAGVTARGSGVFSSLKLAGFTGAYEVIFRRSVTSCVFLANNGSPLFSGSGVSGETEVVGRVGNIKGVFIQTYDSAGALADRSFHLAVICHK